MLLPFELSWGVVALLVADPARAWSPRSSAGKSSLSATTSTSDRRTLVVPAQGSDEINALISQMESDAAVRPAEDNVLAPSNPSCFFLSLSAIPSQAPCEALSRSDTARVEVAASWAICEIKTAGTGIGKLPRECEDWHGGGKTGVADCVEALSRSPQHWSSYSQNLREVVTLCSSFRRWADLETARSLYASTASTFDAFLGHLKEFERVRSQRETTDAKTRSSMSSNLSSLASSLTTLTTGLSTNHARHSGSLALLETSLATAISKIESQVSLYFQTEIDGLLGALSTRGREMASELQLSVQEHGRELAGVSGEVRDVLGLALRDLQASVGDMVGQVERLDSGIQRSRLAVDTSSSVLEQMATTTKDLSRTLSDYHSTHDAMLKLHQSHIHDMEEIFANISLAAKDGFALPDLSFGGIVYIASRGIMRRSAHGAVLLVSLLVRPFWWPMMAVCFTLLSYLSLAIARRLWRTVRRFPSGWQSLPTPGDWASPHPPHFLAPETGPVPTVPRRRRPSRIPARLYSGKSWENV